MNLKIKEEYLQSTISLKYQKQTLFFKLSTISDSDKIFLYTNNYNYLFEDIDLFEDEIQLDGIPGILSSSIQPQNPKKCKSCKQKNN